MIEALALLLAAAQGDLPQGSDAQATCPYGIEHFIGRWRAAPSGAIRDEETSVIEFWMSGGRSEWRQYLHYRELDNGRWVSADECGTITLLNPSSQIIVARFKVIDRHQIQLERSGQVFTRAPLTASELLDEA